ncbi:hypothetical protein ACEN9F_22650 [Duganella sp. CT11-25]|uniref:hypothetical protein n=1 Tax=unclassified Duganella TaxID=2636909 RepID=UPI0039B05B38
MARLNITQGDVEAIRLKKYKARGGFDKGLLLSKTKLASTFLAVEKDMLSSESKHSNRTLSLPSDLPVLASEIHSDKRFDDKGTMERQFTVLLPAHAENIGSLKTLFSLKC